MAVVMEDCFEYEMFAAVQTQQQDATVYRVW